MANHLATRSKTLLAPELDYFLVDGSASMTNQWWPLMAATDAFCDVLRARAVKSHLICSVFSGSNTQMIQRDLPLADAKPFSVDPLTSTWGMTPLRDAINHMGRHLRDLNPSRCSICIVTDGDDTSSQTSVAQAKSILDWCRAHGWQITFIGCDFDNERLARQLGASPENTVGVAAPLLTDAMKALADKRVRHSQTGEDMHFSNSERKTFGGYLTKS